VNREPVPLCLPKESVSDDRYLLSAWRVADGGSVAPGEVVADVESSKAVHEIESPVGGYLHHVCREGDEVVTGGVVAFLSSSPSFEPAQIAAARKVATAAESTPGVEHDGGGTKQTRFSKAALEVLERHGVDRWAFGGQGLVRARDVEVYLGAVRQEEITQQKAADEAHAAEKAAAAQARPPAVIEASEVSVLSSAVTGQRYRISVCLPPGYARSDQTYPTLYMLAAAGAGLCIMTGISRLMNFGQEIPELIIVSVGYDTDVFENRLLCRRRDYTPTPMADKPGSGGADKFRRCLVEEIFPFIDANYRTHRADRAVAGLSHGGLFALYVLFHWPDLFSRYIVSSPSLWWDDRVIFRYEETYAKTHDALPARVFLSVGTCEPRVKILEPARGLVRILSRRDYKALALTVAELEGESHYSGHAMAFAKGLKAVYGG